MQHMQAFASMLAAAAANAGLVAPSGRTGPTDNTASSTNADCGMTSIPVHTGTGQSETAAGVSTAHRIGPPPFQTGGAPVGVANARNKRARARCAHPVVPFARTAAARAVSVGRARVQAVRQRRQCSKRQRTLL